MKKTAIAIAIFLGIIALVSTAMVLVLMRGMKDVLQEEIAEIDISTIEDGVYVGRYEHYRWTSKVEVVIASGQIVSISLIEDHQIPNDITSAILFQRVIDANALDVDMVTGGTVSSIAYLKAIEDALSE